MAPEETVNELQEIKQGVATVNENLERIEKLLEGLQPKFKLTGKIDLNNAEFHMHMAAWNRAIGEMQLIKGALSRLK